ncbi:MAG: hypothetical protein IH597_03220 [Bacteroidales bacterium]|nr:hypothetical protein [Bacteroidales bacterium]
MDFFSKIFKDSITGPSRKIRQGFAMRYPDARSIEWINQNGVFEAIFYEHDLEKIARFDLEGNFLEVRTNLSPDDIPSTVKANIDSGMEIMNCIVADNNASIFYELIVRNQSLIRFLIIVDESGTIIRNEKL